MLAQKAYDKKGQNITIMDLEGISMLSDYFVVVSASNPKHAQSVADEMEDAGAEAGVTVVHREGYREGEWILLDFGDIICHIFSGEAREFYGLEELWSDAATVPFEESNHGNSIGGKYNCHSQRCCVKVSRALF